MDDNEDVEQLLEDIEKREGSLSEWEAQFIDSVQHQLRKGHFLSPKQVTIVNRIWDRVT